MMAAKDDDVAALSVDGIRQAATKIRPHVARSPIKHSRGLSCCVGFPICLKLENVQPCGSFKIRGVLSRLQSMAADQRSRGVITASTGNHGLALGCAARALGVPAWVYLSNIVPKHRLARIAATGAHVIVEGASQDEAVERARIVAVNTGMEFIPPFDDPQVIAGQGTIGLELAEDLIDVEAVIVPVSGGGLISGILIALKSLRPRVRVIGVSIENGSAMAASLAAGRPVAVPEVPSIADNLGGGIGSDNKWTLAIVKRLVDDFVVVDDESIKQSMRLLYQHEGIVCEGAGAVGVAALLSGKLPTVCGPAVTVISGGNASPEAVRNVIKGTSHEAHRVGHP